MTIALLVVLKITVTIIIFGIGLDSTLHDAVRLFRHPALLLRSLLAMYVLVPLAAVGLVILLPLPAGAEAGLLVLAVSAGAPLLPRKLLGIGDGAYIFSLVVVSSALAVILVPLWLEMLSPLFPRLPRLAPEKTALVLGESFFLPLLAGMAIRRYFPKLAAWTGGRADGRTGGRSGGLGHDAGGGRAVGRELACGSRGQVAGYRGSVAPDPDCRGHRPPTNPRSAKAISSARIHPGSTSRNPIARSSTAGSSPSGSSARPIPPSCRASAS